MSPDDPVRLEIRSTGRMREVGSHHTYRLTTTHPQPARFGWDTAGVLTVLGPISTNSERFRAAWPKHLKALPFGRPLPMRSGGHVIRAYRRSEEHTSELQSLRHLVCRLLLEKKIR